MHERDVVHAASQIREQVADPFAGLPILLKLPFGLDDPALIALTAPAEGLHFDGLSVPFRYMEGL